MLSLNMPRYIIEFHVIGSKYQIFMEYIFLFTGIANIINAELITKPSPTPFVVQLAEHYTRFAG